MRVHLIKWKSVDAFVVKHARSKTSFEGFKEGIKCADWNSVNDVQQTFGSADVINVYSKFKQLSIKGDEKTILAFVDVITAMRKDLSLDESTPEDIFNLFVVE